MLPFSVRMSSHTIGHRCSDHGGEEQSNDDLEMMIHNENQKGLRYVIINFTPSYAHQSI